MKNSGKKESSWEWYAVKLLFESIIVGEPNPQKIDNNYSNQFKTYEESIILVKAQSFEHAYKIAEKKAKEAEMEYYNPYDQMVKCRLVDTIDCFQLFDDELKSGTEVYSRLLHVPVKEKTEKVIEVYYPETMNTDDNEPDYYYPFRLREFNYKETEKE